MSWHWLNSPEFNRISQNSAKFIAPVTHHVYPSLLKRQLWQSAIFWKLHDWSCRVSKGAPILKCLSAPPLRPPPPIRPLVYHNSAKRVSGVPVLSCLPRLLLAFSLIAASDSDSTSDSVDWSILATPWHRNKWTINLIKGCSHTARDSMYATFRSVGLSVGRPVHRFIIELFL